MANKRYSTKLLPYLFSIYPILLLRLCPPVAQATLVGDWKCSEGGGNTLYDGSLYDNDGIGYSIIQWATDRNGTQNEALYFNGSTAGVSISDSNSLDITENITICAWIKLDTDVEKGNILTKWNNNNQNSYAFAINDKKLNFQVSIDGNSIALNIKGNTELSDNQWHHAAVIYEQLTNTTKLFLDGVIDAVTHFYGGDIYTTTTNVLIGKYGIAAPLQGYLDDIKLYNEALSDMEIAQEAGLLVLPKVDYSTWPESDPIITFQRTMLLTGYKLNIEIENSSVLYNFDIEVDPIPSETITITPWLPKEPSILTMNVINKSSSLSEQTFTTVVVGAKKEELKEFLYFSYYSPRFDTIDIDSIQALNNSPYTAFNFYVIGNQYSTPIPELSNFNTAINIINNTKAQGKSVWPLVFTSRFNGGDPDINSNEYYINIKGYDLYDNEGALSDFIDLFILGLELASNVSSPGVYVDPETYNNYDADRIEYLADLYEMTEGQIIDRLNEIGATLADIVDEHYSTVVLWWYYINFPFIVNNSIYRRASTYIVEGMLQQAKNEGYQFKIIDGWLGSYFYTSLEEAKNQVLSAYINAYQYKQEYPNFDVGPVICPYENGSSAQSWIADFYNNTYYMQDLHTIEDFEEIYKLLLYSSEYVWTYGAIAAGTPYGYNEYDEETAEAYDTEMSSALNDALAMQGIQCFLKLDENSMDYSGSRNHAQIIGNESYTTGRKGQAVYLDGDTNYVDLPISVFAQDQGSWSCWFKHDFSNNENSDVRIFNSLDSRGTNYEFRTWGKSTLYWYVGNGDTIVSKHIGAISDNTWTHVVYTWEYDIGNNYTVIRGYKNGNEIGSPSIIAGKIQIPLTAVTIGNWRDNSFNGEIDNFRIYSYALNTDKISELYGSE